MAQLVTVSALGGVPNTYCTLQHTGPLIQKRKLVLQCVKGGVFREVRRAADRSPFSVIDAELRERAGGQRKRAAVVFSGGFNVKQ